MRCKLIIKNKILFSQLIQCYATFLIIKSLDDSSLCRKILKQTQCIYKSSVSNKISTNTIHHIKKYICKKNDILLLINFMLKFTYCCKLPHSLHLIYGQFPFKVHKAVSKCNTVIVVLLKSLIAKFSISHEHIFIFISL